MAWRTLFKNQKFSMINVGGLAIGMAVGIIIGQWIWDGLSFNTHHGDHRHIALVMRHFKNDGELFTGGQSSPIPLALNYKLPMGLISNRLCYRPNQWNMSLWPVTTVLPGFIFSLSRYWYQEWFAFSARWRKRRFTFMEEEASKSCCG